MSETPACVITGHDSRVGIILIMRIRDECGGPCECTPTIEIARIAARSTHGNSLLPELSYREKPFTLLDPFGMRSYQQEQKFPLPEQNLVAKFDIDIVADRPLRKQTTSRICQATQYRLHLLPLV